MYRIGINYNKNQIKITELEQKNETNRTNYRMHFSAFRNYCSSDIQRGMGMKLLEKGFLKEIVVITTKLPKSGGFGSIASGKNNGCKVFIPSHVLKQLEVAETYLCQLVWNTPSQQDSCPYQAISAKKIDEKLIELSDVQMANYEKLLADLIERVKQGTTTVWDGEILEILFRENG